MKHWESWTEHIKEALSTRFTLSGSIAFVLIGALVVIYG